MGSAVMLGVAVVLAAAAVTMMFGTVMRGLTSRMGCGRNEYR